MQIINNCNPDLYFNRPKKNINYAMKDLKSKKVKIMAIIIMDYVVSELKSPNEFSLIKHIRKHPDLKKNYYQKMS